MTRVAVVDIGTNSTRLLVAEPESDGLRELARESIVTRLGEGVDATGRLGDEPQARVFRVLDGFRETMDAHDADVRTVVMPSLRSRRLRRSPRRPGARGCRYVRR